MEVVDAQVHLNQILPDWRTADHETLLRSGVAAMDAVGVNALLVSETWGFDAQMRPANSEELPNGAIRPRYPFSELAVTRYPERFVYHCRVDLKDPDIDKQVASVQARAGAVALRIVPIPDTGDVDRLAQGEFEPIFAAAERHQVPVFCWLPGRSQLLIPYVKKFSKLQFILDHCGVGIAPLIASPTPPTLMTSITETLSERRAQIDQVIDLAQYPNLALKWCHAPAYLSSEPFPHRDMFPLFRRVIDAFGAQRIMWGSDYTQSRTETGATWAQSLHYLLYSDEVSETEKEWIFGRTIRDVLKWK